MDPAVGISCEANRLASAIGFCFPTLPPLCCRWRFGPQALLDSFAGPGRGSPEHVGRSPDSS
eukprot:4605906-Alexandrium_andersonii.AAC.1